VLAVSEGILREPGRGNTLSGTLSNKLRGGGEVVIKRDTFPILE